MKKPYVIIGAGIIGSAIAREIRKRDLGDVIVLEKEKEFGMHQSGRNSGVLHSGINQLPGSLKAELCIKGNGMAREFCKEKKVPYEECGTWVIARNEEEKERMGIVYSRGLRAGVPGLGLVRIEEMREKEPTVLGVSALYSPTGAIVDSKAFLEAVVDDAKRIGAEFVMGARTKEVKENTAITTAGDFKYGYLINCAGLHADKIALMDGVDTGLRVIGFRGDYRIVDASINSMIYQVPDLRFPFLGVHLTKSIDGKVLAGPSASLSWRGRESYDGEINWKEITGMLKSGNFWRMIFGREFLGLAWHNGKLAFSDRAFLGEINSLLEKKITMAQIHQYQSGIRAQMVDRKGKMINEFVIERGENSTHVLNAVSPGLTSSLAFVEYVVDRYVNKE